MKPRALLEQITRLFSSRRGGSGSRDSSRQEKEDLEAIAAREQRAFRYEALEKATRNFAAKQKLGQGGFGPVYRGRLEDGREVAVKRLGAGSRQGVREFRNEATLLSRVQHRNVVNLIGYCAHGADDKLLVYEYVPNESLDKILFSSSPPPPATATHWTGDKRSTAIAQRVAIASLLQLLEAQPHNNSRVILKSIYNSPRQLLLRDCYINIYVM